MVSLLLSRSVRLPCRAAPPTIFPARMGSNNNLVPQRLFSSSPASSDRVSRTLYRQLLQWCQRRQKIDGNVPLSFLIPPIHMKAPDQVDPYRLELLAHNFYTDKKQRPQGGFTLDEEKDAADVQRARHLLPSRVQVEPKHMTVPMDSIADLQGFFGAIYRLNRRKETDHHKSRITAAFEALKSLHQLTGGLDSLREQRETHLDRTGVQFRVGEIVQHKQERFRGVVAGWSVVVDTTDAKTSLTSKQYALDDDFSTAADADAATDSEQGNDNVNERIRYDIILDAGDAHSMGKSSGWSKTLQSDLVPVTDHGLCRIRSNVVTEYFTRFDSETQTFTPNALLSHEYPMDSLDTKESNAPPKLSKENIQLCDDIVTGVQELASRLERIILDETSCPKERKWQLLAETQAQLSRIASGDVVPTSMRLQSPDPVSLISLASLHLRALLNLSLETMDILFQRQTAKKHKGKLRFSIGDIVNHKIFQFRGVVVAWDPKPTMDVTRWDGLGHIDNPMELPFYHVIPDHGDCVEAFGGERPLRYVCEENLEECPANRKMIDVSLQSEWGRNPSDGSYVAPSELRFKYGEDLEDDGATERCMNRIQDELSNWQIGARESTIDDPVIKKLSTKNLHGLLQVVDTLNDAMTLQETIKEMRNAHPRQDLRWQLDKAVEDMMGGKSEEALAAFQALVEEDPEYAEAWNKISTCKFLSGDLDESLEAAEKALEIDPFHFQALNGLGLIYFQKEDYRAAISSFRKSMSIDPWSAVPSKLSVCIDLLAQTGEPDKEGSI
jgi:hemimethylated DNA binding protein